MALTRRQNAVKIALRLAIATLITIINLILLGAPLVAQAQPAAPPSGRLWRVGILFQAATERGGPYLEAILQGFRDLGYVEGRDLTIELRSAAGDLTRLPQLAQELVRLPVDVIMTPRELTPRWRLLPPSAARVKRSRMGAGRTALAWRQAFDG